MVSNDLQVFMPERDERILSLLRSLSDTLQQEFLPEFYEQQRQKKRVDQEGIRVIQQGRLELYVQSKHRSCKAFDNLCRMILDYRPSYLHTSFFSTETMRDGLIEYAKRAAKLDQRLGEDVVFGEYFSLIISDGKVAAQMPHVDLLYPGFQFGLVVTDNVPGTRTYRSNIPAVETPADFMDFLGVTANETSKIGQLLEQSKPSLDTLRQFGVCLSTVDEANYEVTSQLENLDAASLISVPGSVLHAGPGTNSFRTVLFFTAHRPNTGTYDPDVQYFDGLLLGEILLTIWNGITIDDRRALLGKLYTVVQRYPDLYRHFLANLEFDQFLRELATTDDPTTCMNAFVRSGPQISTTEPLNVNEMQCVSVENLLTIYNGEPEPIAVYRGSDDSIYLQYRRIMQWESAGVNVAPYRLVFKNDSLDHLFDGRNGVLKTGKGYLIHCFVVSDNEHNNYDQGHDNEQEQQNEGVDEDSNRKDEDGAEVSLDEEDDADWLPEPKKRRQSRK